MFFTLQKLINNPDWFAFFEEQCCQNYWQQLEKKLLKQKYFYPPPKKIFRIFNNLSPKNIKIVILGQDPYHQKEQADGFAFSTKNKKIPASLKNIYKEIFKNNIPTNGDLSKWVAQGVFLLNRILTVQDSQPLSHKDFGWQEFTARLMNYLDESPKCFLLWGAEAQKITKYLKNKEHCILQTSHPSPLSVYRGFLGCGHFEKVNYWLKKHNQTPINWSCLK